MYGIVSMKTGTYGTEQVFTNDSFDVFDLRYRNFEFLGLSLFPEPYVSETQAIS
jgi:hypothetical protein